MPESRFQDSPRVTYISVMIAMLSTRRLAAIGNRSAAAKRRRYRMTFLSILNLDWLIVTPPF